MIVENFATGGQILGNIICLVLALDRSAVQLILRLTLL